MKTGATKIDNNDHNKKLEIIDESCNEIFSRERKSERKEPYSIFDKYST